MLIHLRLAILIGVAVIVSGCSSDATGQDSGGELLPEQAAYDVTFYDLSVDVDTASSSITGSLTAVAAVKRPLQHLVLNLDKRLQVDGVMLDDQAPVSVERRADSNQVWIELSDIARPGDTIQATVQYSGSPRVAPRPPWDGGFTWAQTPGGEPWIATSCQTIGADVWWPVKDHPSDEPDSMAINITVPRPLVAASNGRLRDVVETVDRRTYRWFVSTPINTYGVALNAAPYVEIDTTYRSTAATDVPVTFYALPGDSTRARAALPHFLDHVRFLEETLGPYPFRRDKYGIAQTPFKGMEHQSIIAYGNDFNLEGGLYYPAGFDALHFHELAHEWYGNLITVQDWKDFWIHEGFATYLEALYREELQGNEGYWKTIRFWNSRIENERPVARSVATSAQEMYGGDVYYKGALILHTLRYVIGDEAFGKLLRAFTYPEAEGETNKSPYRHVSTADFVHVAEDVSQRQLDAFFRVYLYQAPLPTLEVVREGDAATLTWTNTGSVPFDVPVPVAIDGETRRVDMTGGQGTIQVPAGASMLVDEQGWVLKEITVDSR